MRSPVAEQVKPYELDLHWLLEGEVKKDSSLSRFSPRRVDQLILHQGLPRAGLVHWAGDFVVFGGIGGSISQVLDLKADNHPWAGVQFQGKALPGCLFPFCQPVVVLAIANPSIFFTQYEDTACWVGRWEGTALNHLWSQRARTIYNWNKKIVSEWYNCNTISAQFLSLLLLSSSSSS